MRIRDPRGPRASRSTVDVDGPWELEGLAPRPCVRCAACPPGLERSAAARGDERRSNPDPRARVAGSVARDPRSRRPCHAAVGPERRPFTSAALPYPVLPRTRYCHAGRRYRLTTDPSAARRTSIGSQTEARLNIFSRYLFPPGLSGPDPMPYGTAPTVTLLNFSFENYGPGLAGKISAIRGR